MKLELITGELVPIEDVPPLDKPFFSTLYLIEGELKFAMWYDDERYATYEEGYASSRKKIFNLFVDEDVRKAQE